MTDTLYKFLRTGMKSDSGHHVWKVGEWYHVDDIAICKCGFHASRLPRHAQKYVNGEIIAKVEARGLSIVQNDKECWSDMRVVEAWHWTKEDSVEQAIFFAELVLGIFERDFPFDDRPRRAVEAARAYLSAGDDGKAAAAKAAAYAAYAAAYADDADDAADAAAYAADAADDAADYAADAARAAANADEKDLLAKVDLWFEEKMKTLKPLPPPHKDTTTTTTT